MTNITESEVDNLSPNLEISNFIFGMIFGIICYLFVSWSFTDEYHIKKKDWICSKIKIEDNDYSTAQCVEYKIRDR